jgi:hypothetical protein
LSADKLAKIPREFVDITVDPIVKKGKSGRIIELLISSVEQARLPRAFPIIPNGRQVSHTAMPLRMGRADLWPIFDC